MGVRGEQSEAARSVADDQLRRELGLTRRKVERLWAAFRDAGALEAAECVDEALGALDDAEAVYLGTRPARASAALTRAIALVKGSRARRREGEE